MLKWMLLSYSCLSGFEVCAKQLIFFAIDKLISTSYTEFWIALGGLRRQAAPRYCLLHRAYLTFEITVLCFRVVFICSIKCCIKMYVRFWLVNRGVRTALLHQRPKIARASKETGAKCIINQTKICTLTTSKNAQILFSNFFFSSFVKLLVFLLKGKGPIV